MESPRWLRLAPLALAITAGGLLGGGHAAGTTQEPPWEPPACTGGTETAPPGATAWYRLDPVLDGTGALASTDLVVGSTASPERRA